MHNRAIHIFVMIVACISIAMISGCDPKECEPCEAATPCPVVQGTYYGVFYITNSTCSETGLPPGEVKAVLSGQVLDGTGSGAIENDLVMELTDFEGNWTKFEGFMCNSDPDLEPDETPTYYFDVVYRSTDPAVDPQVTNRMTGKITLGSVDGEDVIPAAIEAKYHAIAKFDDENMDCTASGEFLAYL